MMHETTTAIMLDLSLRNVSSSAGQSIPDVLSFMAAR
jgi:hypothetical protein